MGGELEAAGALTTAGLAAGAIEGRSATQASEGACLNCGATLAGRYCAQCGQAAHAHRTLSHMFEEVLHGLFHFDTKAWRTLPLLVARPGTLTRNYIYGKRARYISPLALFLFTIFLMFFVFAFVSPNVLDVNANPQASAEMRADLREDIAEARAELQQAENELAAERAERGAAAPSLEQKLSDETSERSVALARGVVERLEARLARETEAAQAPIVIHNEPPPPAAPPAGPDAPTAADGVQSGEAASVEAGEGERRWQDEVSEAAKNGKIDVGSPFPALNERIVHSLENPDLALYKIQQAAYKFSFLLVPISLPFMWLLFIWKRGLTLYDHAVFTLYSLAFASLVFIFIAMTAGVSWLNWVGGVVLGLGMPVHMFFHLKGAYALGWWSAIWRTSLLLLFALMALTIFVVTIVLLGLGG